MKSDSSLQDQILSPANHIDTYSKYTICITLPYNYISIEIINAYYEYVHSHVMSTEDIVIHLNTIFTSFQWLQFCRTQHINQSMSTAYDKHTHY